MKYCCIIRVYGQWLGKWKVSVVPKLYLFLVTFQLSTQSDFPGGFCLWKGVAGYISICAGLLFHSCLYDPDCYSLHLCKSCAGLCQSIGGSPWSLVGQGGGISALRVLERKAR